VRLLLEAGASVTVLAPEVSLNLHELADHGRIVIERRHFSDRSLAPFWLVIAATDDTTTNAQVAAAAESAQKFCNVVDDLENCTFIMPAIVDRDPVTVAISTAGFSPVLARWAKGIIEAALPRRLGALAKLAKTWRERVKAAILDADARRHFWQAAIEGEVAEHVLAGRAAEGEAALDNLLRRWVSGSYSATTAGEAYLVGAGPGASDLITLRGRELLARADVVLYDRLVNAEILSFARRDAEFYSVGKTPGQHSIRQSEINELLVELVKTGKKVCRLKGGDPMVFGRVGEELEALVTAGLRFQIVPGVSAMEGCAAYAGIPLTLRGVSQSILLTTGHTESGAIGSLGAVHSDQTIALYMGVSRYGDIAMELLDHGLRGSTPVAVIENGTTDAQRVFRTTLAELESTCSRHAVTAPALLLVGETTVKAEAYAWFTPVIRSDSADPATSQSDVGCARALE